MIAMWGFPRSYIHVLRVASHYVTQLLATQRAAPRHNKQTTSPFTRCRRNMMKETYLHNPVLIQGKDKTLKAISVATLLIPTTLTNILPELVLNTHAHQACQSLWTTAQRSGEFQCRVEGSANKGRRRAPVNHRGDHQRGVEENAT